MDSFNPLLFSTLHGSGSVGNVDEHSAEHPVDLNEKEQVSKRRSPVVKFLMIFLRIMEMEKKNKCRGQNQET